MFCKNQIFEIYIFKLSKRVKLNVMLTLFLCPKPEMVLSFDPLVKNNTFTFFARFIQPLIVHTDIS